MFRKSKKKSDPGAPGVPAYIVTFSDMVTLLLTFFVMLLSLAQVQDEELFNKSRDAFVEHINCYGLGLLSGKKLVPELGQMKPKFHIPDPDDASTERTVDSKDETLRRLFRKATKFMEAVPSRVQLRLSDYTVTNINFSPGQTELNESSEKYLNQFVVDFRQQLNSRKAALYVLGLAADESTKKRQWIVSSLRAQRVAEYLEQAGFECPVYAWGGGAGGCYVDRDSPLSDQSQILIAILRAGDMD